MEMAQQKWKETNEKVQREARKRKLDGRSDDEREKGEEKESKEPRTARSSVDQEERRQQPAPTPEDVTEKTVEQAYQDMCAKLDSEMPVEAAL